MYSFDPLMYGFWGDKCLKRGGNCLKKRWQMSGRQMSQPLSHDDSKKRHDVKEWQKSELVRQSTRVRYKYSHRVSACRLGWYRWTLSAFIQFVFVFIDEFSGRMARKYFIQFVFALVVEFSGTQHNKYNLFLLRSFQVEWGGGILFNLSWSLLMSFQVERRWVLISF